MINKADLACSECGLQHGAGLSHGDRDEPGARTRRRVRPWAGRPIIIGPANAWLRASVAAARATVTGR
jgi:hypothetical protein